MNKITAKIQKLLALSKSSNAHEAESAMRKANDLMTKHQIAMSEVIVDELASTSKASFGESHSVSETYRSFVGQIARAAGMLFDTKPAMTGVSSFMFIGMFEDIARAELMFHYLFNSWLDIVKTDTKEYKEFVTGVGGEPTQYNIKQYKIAHGQGFTDTILVRAKALADERKSELEEKASTGTDLVVMKEDLIKEFMKENTKTRSSHFKTQKNIGQEHGIKAGREIRLAGKGVNSIVVDGEALPNPEAV